MGKILNISGIDCYEENGVAYLRLETVARGLGFTVTQTVKGKEYTNIRWDRVEGYLEEIGFTTSGKRPDFIPENIFYRLAMKAKNETAEKFQAKVADEIIPSIRKYGGYGNGMSAELEQKLLDYIERQEERISQLEKRAEMKGIKYQPNPFKPRESADEQRVRNLNELTRKVSKLCGMKKNKLLHYLYRTIEENLGVSIDFYSEVYRETAGHSWDSTLEVVCNYDDLYKEAVKLCEETIERKSVFG
ncbi:MAG: hypothetical protein NC293_13605 [Roseburia sp.]|nr:hypothetical protein [Roseburia sp.]